MERALESAFENEFEETLVEALEALENGESVEAVLRRYPAHTVELRQVLEATAQLARLPLSPSATSQEASKRVFLERSQQLRKQKHNSSGRPLRRFLLSFVSLLLVLLVAGLFASQEAIPGDPLYQVKRSVEEARLYLASPAQEAQLRSEFEQERNHEVYQMLDRGRDGVAGYTGVIEEMGEEQWELGNITIQITDDTIIQGTPEEGNRVEAHCRIQDGHVYAESLVVLNDDP